MAAAKHTYEQLETAFRHGNFKPLYFLYGDEKFPAEQLQHLLLEHALAPHERDFNLDIIYGHESDASSALGACSSYPVMAERRVVIIREFEKLQDNDLFKEYAAHPNPTAIVVLVCGTRPNLSRHPYRALVQHAVSMESKPLYERQMPGWIQRTAKSRGFQIDPEAVKMLVDFVGVDMRVAYEEMEKLTTYTGGRKTITADDVVHASGHTREFNVFELVRAVGERREKDAHRIAERMLQQAANVRGEAARMVAMLNLHFTRLWKLAAAKGRLPEDKLAGRIGVNPYFIKEYVGGLRRYGIPSMETAFAALLAADYELKGGAPRDARVVMTLTLRRILAATA